MEENYFNSVKPKETAKVNVPIKNDKCELGYEMTEISILEPFSVVQYMFCEAGLEVDYDQVEKFWGHHRSVGSPWAKHSKASSRHIPLGLHADGAKIRQLAYCPPQKLVGIFLNAPLWRPKAARASRWLLCCIREEHLYKHHTLNKIYHHIVWSLNLLYDGFFPHTGPNGEILEGKAKERAGLAICGGMRFAVTELRADWLYHKEALRFRSSWKGGASIPVCFQCPAMASGACAYYHVDVNSILWQKQYSLVQFLVDQMPANDPSC